MILTEEEAKTKRCQEGFFEPSGHAHVLNCIGSQCMAWRWQEGSFKKVSAEEWIPQGFCGKAGRP